MRDSANPFSLYSAIKGSKKHALVAAPSVSDRNLINRPVTCLLRREPILN
jgi:hypothetical protein